MAKMKHSLLVFALIIGAFMSLNTLLQAETNPIQIECNRPSHIYRVGEKAVFSIRSQKSELLNVTLSADDDVILHKFKMTAPGSFNFTLPHPGFLRVKVSSKNKKTAEAGVAFDPEQIRPVLPEPADFDAFWENIWSKQKAVPANFKMTERPDLAAAGYSFYELRCDNINDTKVYGYLRLPQGKGPFPLLVYVEGYGRGQSLETFQEHCRNVSKYCRGNIAALTIGVLPFAFESDAELKKKFAEYTRQCPGGNYWLKDLDSEDMTRTFFALAISGAVRLCDLVCALPVIDQKRIVYYGVSQGGGFGIYLTANCPQIKALFCGVPAFGDCGGFLQGRHSTQSNIGAFRTHYEKLRYFDTANFARRIKVPVYMSAGFIDSICPPSSIYAVYNQLQGNKMFYNKTFNGHNDGSAEYTQSTWSFVDRHLR